MRLFRCIEQHHADSRTVDLTSIASARLRGDQTTRGMADFRESLVHLCLSGVPFYGACHGRTFNVLVLFVDAHRISFRFPISIFSPSSLRKQLASDVGGSR